MAASATGVQVVKQADMWDTLLGLRAVDDVATIRHVEAQKQAAMATTAQSERRQMRLALLSALRSTAQHVSLADGFEKRRRVVDALASVHDEIKMRISSTTKSTPDYLGLRNYDEIDGDNAFGDLPPLAPTWVHALTYVRSVAEKAAEVEERAHNNTIISSRVNESGSSRTLLDDDSKAPEATQISEAPSEVSSSGAPAHASRIGRGTRAAVTAQLRLLSAAVEMLVSGCRTAVATVGRPPGHHAGGSAALQRGASQGFCIFNGCATVAAELGLRHYLDGPSLNPRRILIGAQLEVLLAVGARQATLDVDNEMTGQWATLSFTNAVRDELKALWRRRAAILAGATSVDDYFKTAPMAARAYQTFLRSHAPDREPLLPGIIVRRVLDADYDSAEKLRAAIGSMCINLQLFYDMQPAKIKQVGHGVISQLRSIIDGSQSQFVEAASTAMLSYTRVAPEVPRIAIVDIDTHLGNGTLEIARSIAKQHGLHETAFAFMDNFAHDVVCYKCGYGGTLLMCDEPTCVRVAHLACMDLTVEPEGKWICDLPHAPYDPIASETSIRDAYRGGRLKWERWSLIDQDYGKRPLKLFARTGEVPAVCRIDDYRLKLLSEDEDPRLRAKGALLKDLLHKAHATLWHPVGSLVAPIRGEMAASEGLRGTSNVAAAAKRSGSSSISASASSSANFVQSKAMHVRAAGEPIPARRGASINPPSPPATAPVTPAVRFSEDVTAALRRVTPPERLPPYARSLLDMVGDKGLPPPQLAVLSVHQFAANHGMAGYGSHTITHDGLYIGDAQVRVMATPEHLPKLQEYGAAGASPAAVGGAPQSRGEASAAASSSTAPEVPQFVTGLTPELLSVFNVPRDAAGAALPVPYLVEMNLPVAVPWAESPKKDVDAYFRAKDAWPALVLDLRGPLMTALREFKPHYVVVAGGLDASGEDRLGYQSVPAESFGGVLDAIRMVVPRAQLLTTLEGGYGKDIGGSVDFAPMGRCLDQFLSGAHRFALQADMLTGVSVGLGGSNARDPDSARVIASEVRQFVARACEARELHAQQSRQSASSSSAPQVDAAVSLRSAMDDFGTTDEAPDGLPESAVGPPPSRPAPHRRNLAELEQEGRARKRERGDASVIGEEDFARHGSDAEADDDENDVNHTSLQSPHNANPTLNNGRAPADAAVNLQRDQLDDDTPVCAEANALVRTAHVAGADVVAVGRAAVIGDAHHNSAGDVGGTEGVHFTSRVRRHGDSSFQVQHRDCERGGGGSLLSSGEPPAKRVDNHDAERRSQLAGRDAEYLDTLRSAVLEAEALVAELSRGGDLGVEDGTWRSDPKCAEALTTLDAQTAALAAATAAYKNTSPDDANYHQCLVVANNCRKARLLTVERISILRKEAVASLRSSAVQKLRTYAEQLIAEAQTRVAEAAAAADGRGRFNTEEANAKAVVEKATATLSQRAAALQQLHNAEADIEHLLVASEAKQHAEQELAAATKEYATLRELHERTRTEASRRQDAAAQDVRLANAILQRLTA